MPKYLFICRHAEAEDPVPGQPDFDRNITAAGILQARRTGGWLLAQHQVERIVASSARRTDQTSRVLAEMLSVGPDSIVMEKDLYNAPVKEIVKVVSQLPDNLEKVLLIGHNPGISQIIKELTGTRSGFLEPANVAILIFETETWQETEFISGQLQAVFPVG